MDKKESYFVVSLDFELFWGMSDVTTLDVYGERIRGVRTALPRILDLFTQYGIHATWATVGMLMARNRDELMPHLPDENDRPRYQIQRLSSYYHLEFGNIGYDEKDDPYHYGSSLVELILQTPHQELANHTFSHFYPIEKIDNRNGALTADLHAHARISKTYGVTTSSIVFPRNQTDQATLAICAENGMRAYRGNEEHFLYRARTKSEQSLFVRALRLLDHYVNLSGHNTYRIEDIENGKERICNVPASRFLRPCLPALKLFEPLRLRRIKNSMTHAAKHDQVFHLWWHPHNFGVNQEENFKNLITILEHFKFLQEKFGMESMSMQDISALKVHAMASSR